MNYFVFILVGTIIVLSVWIPLFVRGTPLSVPMIAVAGGFLAPLPAGVHNPMVAYAPIIEHATEVVLLAAIYGAGLKVDRRFSIHGWRTTWRLLLVVMPLSVLLIAACGVWLLGLSPGMAIVLGAILAPTDPVLASGLQVGPPGTGQEDEVRFGLTTEAGLNDGIVFPIVMLGVFLTEGKITGWSDIATWGTTDLALSIAGGAVVGAGVGLAIRLGNRLMPERMRLSATNSGIVGLAIAFIIYGVCELVHINGFVAVFFQAIAVRHPSSPLAYHRRLAHTTEQIELMIMVFIMTFFGFALSHGLLDDIGPQNVAVAVLALLVIRPVTTLLSQLGAGVSGRERGALGYFGIRGIGSLFYITYVIANHPEAWNHSMVSTVALTVLLSVLLYGTTSDVVVRRYLDPLQKPPTGAMASDDEVGNNV